MEFQERFAEIRENFNLDIVLKKEQEKIIKIVMNGQNCIGILPTGFGKSICFIIPTLMKEKCSLVISPLKSLMKDQSESLQQMGAKTLVVEKKSLTVEEIAEIKRENVQFIFISPEYLNTNAYRSLVKQLDVELLVFDEAHCISEWGEEFRPEFRKVDVVRSILSETPVLALTATANQKVLDDINEYLMLGDDAELVAVVPDRPNIYIEVKRCRQDVEDELGFLLEALQRDLISMKKTIVYCRSYSMAFEVYSFLMEKLGEAAYDGEHCVNNRLVELYTSSTDDESQNRILSEFKLTTSKIRVLVATVAFGMGVQIPDVAFVVNWGAPKTIMSYWQEIGRCARNGMAGYAVMFAYARSLCMTTVDKDIVDLCKHTGCLRKFTLSKFKLDGMKESTSAECDCMHDCELCVCSLCSCCSFCRSLCPCSGKILDPLSMFL